MAVFEKSVQEKHDLDIFDAGTKIMSDSGNDELMPHFIYCGFHYLDFTKLKEIFLNKMRKYGINSSILTMLWMSRVHLMTKEKVKKAYKGELTNDEAWKDIELSINDNLELFVNKLVQGDFEEEYANNFLAPKLTQKELKLVELSNEDYLRTFLYYAMGRNPDVDPEEMKKSDSKSKYVHVRCLRMTFPLTLE